MSTAPRVVSLVPSVTETLLAWGVEPSGVTRFCEQPHLTQVGGTKNPDVAAIVALAPDLVVVNDEENRAEDAAELWAAGLAVHACSPRSVVDVPVALAALARALDLDVAADRLGHPRSDVVPVGLRAFVPIWRRPWMTLGTNTYGSSLLASFGVTTVSGGAADPGDRYPTVELADVEAAGPDVVLAPSEPYSFKPFHLDVLRQVAPVVEVDGQDLFWWGVRTPAAQGRLRAAIASALSR